jgi:hypothetical protein
MDVPSASAALLLNVLDFLARVRQTVTGLQNEILSTNEMARTTKSAGVPISARLTDGRCVDILRCLPVAVLRGVLSCPDWLSVHLGIVDRSNDRGQVPIFV